MYETTSIPRYAEKLFSFFLTLYPKTYRKRFGQDMLFVFQDVCKEELEKNKTLGSSFWVSQILDITKSILEEHASEIQHIGMKKYLQQTLHVNSYNIISMLFLLPVILMTGIETVSRIAQGDLTHYNRPVYAFFSHTFLYWTPVLFTWVILFPLMASLISLIPLLMSFVKRKTRLLTWTFLWRNIVGIAILLFGLGFIALIRLHDFIPCMVHGFMKVGLGQLNHILAVCKNA